MRGAGVLAVLLAALVAAGCCALCSAQLTFTPSWGKRAPPEAGAAYPSAEPFLYLYKLIQAEAQKMAGCSKFPN
nr:adipokinetic hormone 3 [Schistocerca gregaria]